jgi:hypothetical protein
MHKQTHALPFFQQASPNRKINDDVSGDYLLSMPSLSLKI